MNIIDTIKEIDFTILDALQKIHSDVLDVIMRIITTSGNNGYIWIAICIAMLCFKKTRKIGIYTGIVLIIEVILNDGLIKTIIARERPFLQNTGIDTIIKQPSGYSFPSGHSASSFAAATSIFMQNKKIGRPAYVLAALIAFSRLYFYVHFPSDVLTGCLFGTLIGFCVCKLLDKIVKNHNERKKLDGSDISENDKIENSNDSETQES